MGVTRVTRLVSHVDKVLLTVPELSVVSGCNKSNTSGVTRGQGTVTRVTRLVPYHQVQDYEVWLRLLVFNATFNNILVISWRSVLLAEDTGVPEENHRPVACH